MKIDLHTHILPREWPDLDKKYGYPGFIRLEHCDACSARMMNGDRFFREVQSNTWDPARRLEDMDRAGVSMQVLSTVPVMFSYWAKAADALDLSRLLNDHIAEVVRAHPTRFAGLGTHSVAGPRARGARSWSVASANSVCAALKSAPTSMRTSIVTAPIVATWIIRSLDVIWRTAESLGCRDLRSPLGHAG